MARIGTVARFEVSGEILSEDVLALLAVQDAGIPGADMDKAEEGDFYAAWELLRDQWQAIRSEIAEFETERLRRRWIMPMLEMLGHRPDFLRAHPTLPNGASVPITHRTPTIPIWLTDFAEQPDERPDQGRRRRSKHELFQEYLDMSDDDWGILCTGRTIRLLTDYHKTLTRNFVEADLESIFDELDLDAFRIVWRLFRASAFEPKAKGVRDIERIRDHARQQGTEIGKELRKQVVEAVVTLANGFLETDETAELRQAVENDSEGPIRLYQSVLRVVYRLLFLLYVENKPGWTPAQDPRWASGYSISRLRAMAEDPGSYRAEGEDLWEGLKVTFRIIRDGCTLFNEPISPYGGELFDDERLGLLKDTPLANARLLRALYLLTIFERKQGRASTLHRVNFRNLKIDALGSVYESLLEERPILDADGRFSFYHRAGKGNKRKETGSYYTPPELVSELIKTALLPVIEDRLRQACKSLGLEAGNADNWLQEVINDVGTGKQRIQQSAPLNLQASKPTNLQTALRQAILGIAVVDPACGSGAFLIQALDALVEALLKVQLGDEQPSELQLREARRDVAIQCIHGVDMNQMAVELCKFTLWLHVAHPRFPLSYLEPLIRCGNSLVGVPTKSQIEDAKRIIAEERAVNPNALPYVGWEGFDLEPSKLTKIPDEAFAAVGDDDNTFAKGVRDQNKIERTGQLRLTQGQVEDFTAGRLAVYRHMQEVKEDDPEAVKEKTRRFEQYLKSGAYRLPKRFADAWCAAFFWPLKPISQKPHGPKLPEPPGDPVPSREIVPTQHEIAQLHPAKQRAAEPTPVNAQLVAEIERRAEALQFFHWELEFPDVFEKGGFDVVLGNPPWDQVQVDAREFFAGIRNDIAEARTNIRNDLIKKLRAEDPDLYERFAITQHASDGFKKFVHNSGLFPLTEHGRINVAPLFAELNLSMHRVGGRAGFITPTGLVTDSFKQRFFAWLVESKSLAGLIDFENRQKLFDIHRSFKFVLLTLARGGGVDAELRFFLTHPAQIADPHRRIVLSAADFRLMNPNTRTAPVLRTRQDADLLRFIYQRVPVLVREGPNLQTSQPTNLPTSSANPWGIRYQLMFMMNTDSKLFKTSDDLAAMGARYEDGVWVADGTRYLPLYEAKMFHQFDHRWATFAGAEGSGVLDEEEDVALDDEGDGDGEGGGDKAKTRDCTLLEKQDPSFLPNPRYWVSEYDMLMRAAPLTREEKKELEAMDPERVVARLRPRAPKWLIAFRDITNTTNERTAIFSALPLAGAGNKAPLAVLPVEAKMQLAFEALGDSFVWDWICRQKLGGTSFTLHYLKQIATLMPTDLESHVDRIIPLALELVYTSEHLRPLAKEVCRSLGLEVGTLRRSEPTDLQTSQPLQPFVFDEARRARLRAELDALVARLYGLNRKQLRYILCPQGLSWAELENVNDGREDPTCAGPHALPAEPALDFPGETFRVLKEKEERKYGEYRTRRLVLEAWDRLGQELGPVEPLPLRFGPNAPDGTSRKDPKDANTLADPGPSPLLGLFAEEDEGSR